MPGVLNDALSIYFVDTTPCEQGALAGMRRVMTPFSDYGLPVGTTRLELVIAPAHRGIISEPRAAEGRRMRCLLIEDEADTARYICNGLEEAGHSATLVRDGVNGLDLATNERWDIIILDRMLPGGVDGLSIIATLRNLGKTTPVLILSALASLDERVRGLRGGGDDYLTKPFAFSELLARIEVLLRRGNAAEDRRELSIADLRLDLRTRRAERAGQAIALQPREFRLLEYLVRHQGQVVTRTMLLEAVWDYYFDPQTNVIDVQISRLRRKIDKGFSPQLLHTVRGIGYMIAADE
jgi:two-component system OmpR family response regulator